MKAETDQSFIAEVLPAFISEAQEQTEAIEQLLLQLEAAPDDRELLDALFRCAHTVKGSAGIFGLERVVGFTHHVETLLDRLRDGEIAFTPALGTLLLQCNDAIRALVLAADGSREDGAEQAAARDLLVRRLQEHSGAAAAPSSGAAAQAASATAATATCQWQVDVAFGRETFRNGMDPIALLNYLRGLGEVGAVHCDADAVPALDVLDAEACHLALSFGFDSGAPRADIEAAFDFVREDCTLRLEPVPAVPAARSGAASDATPAAPTLRAADDAPRLGEILLASGAISREALEQGLQQQKRQRETAGGEDHRFIRVQADRLDAVINLLGELVIASAGASLLARQARDPRLAEANLQVGALIEEIRNGTLQLRMVPIGETFARFRRVVRDTAAELGKDVQFEIVGGETELDKSVVERIADPLMHLVRNALDHGLEPAAERLAAGKPASGRLALSACHEAGSILIRISDDGRGIQRQKVLQRAWERGLLEAGVVPDDAEILKLIFAPGFSTAETVTNLSGRGVGMDVVRRNIEALRGSVEVLSPPQGGSTIEIRLPLTLAIIDGFLVAVGSSKFVFPLEAVVEVIESRPPTGAPDARGRCLIELRGQALPLVDLRALYALEAPAPARASVVVLQSGSRRYGVLVDQLMGQHQTVIKPLGRMFRSLRGMSGSSILGSGEVALIFDVHALGQMAADVSTSPRGSGRSNQDSSEREAS